MYKAKTISKSKLIELYGGVSRLRGFSKENPEIHEALSPYLPTGLDVLEVEVLSTGSTHDPYAIVKLIDIPRSLNHIIIPRELVNIIELPSAKEKFTTILDKVIGVGKWVYLEDEERLLLLYPELEITNSLGYKHTIYDLVVVVSVSLKGAIKNAHLYGLRGTFTDLERGSSYSHSHLPSGLGMAQNFCLGGKEFYRYVLSLNRVLTADEFEVFLANLYEYLIWESIEGRPHMLISNIGKVTTSTPSYGGSYPTYTESRPGDDLDFDILARTVIMQLPTAPELITKSTTGWILNPGVDTNKYLTIEASIHSHVDSRMKQRYFADFDRSTFMYNSSGTRARNYSPINFGYTEEGWLRLLNVQPRIITTTDQGNSSTIIKMPFPGVRTEIVRRVNFYLALASQQLNTNGEGSNISNKAEGTVVAEPSQSDRVHAQPVS